MSVDCEMQPGCPNVCRLAVAAKGAKNAVSGWESEEGSPNSVSLVPLENLPQSHASRYRDCNTDG